MEGSGKPIAAQVVVSFGSGWAMISNGCPATISLDFPGHWRAEDFITHATFLIDTVACLCHDSGMPM
jgi:hypothetical protein